MVREATGGVVAGNLHGLHGHVGGYEDVVHRSNGSREGNVGAGTLMKGAGLTAEHHVPSWALSPRIDAREPWYIIEVTAKDHGFCAIGVRLQLSPSRAST